MAHIVMKTYGCSNNIAESEMMAGLLEKKGHTVTEANGIIDGDVVIFNMCSVKGPAVTRCLRQIREIIHAEPKKKIIVSGCVPLQLIPEIKGISEGISIVNTHHVEKIPLAVSSLLEEKPQDWSSFARPVKLNFPRRRKNPIISIIPILQGCNDLCTYCSTKLIKGNTFSFPEHMILKEAQQSIKEGCKEIWLTSQDNGAYMTDNGYIGLPALIKRIASLEGDFYIRVGMANPTYIIKCLPELADAMKHERVFKFLHIPVQSGNDEILEKMKRRYTVGQYKEIVQTLKKEIPEITIATDVICGFPGETEEQFSDTLRLVEETRPDIVNISRFQPRPGTKAALMKQLPGGAVKDRSRKMKEAFDRISLENNKGWIGKEFFVLIDEEGTKGNESIGRNLSYKQVVIRRKIALGSLAKVKIIKACVYHLSGLGHDEPI